MWPEGCGGSLRKTAHNRDTVPLISANLHSSWTSANHFYARLDSYAVADVTLQHCNTWPSNSCAVSPVSLYLQPVHNNNASIRSVKKSVLQSLLKIFLLILCGEHSDGEFEFCSAPSVEKQVSQICASKSRFSARNGKYGFRRIPGKQETVRKRTDIYFVHF